MEILFSAQYYGILDKENELWKDSFANDTGGRVRPMEDRYAPTNDVRLNFPDNGRAISTPANPSRCLSCFKTEVPLESSKRSCLGSCKKWRMSKSLLFLPDISGFTEFVQTTEAKHSQHVIAEVLEILIEANSQRMVLAEVEGDALFFYKEEEIPSLEELLAQMERMFTAFYSHLKLLEKNRICPCNACSSAPNLQLKIIAHCGDLEFITVQGKRKPFGTQVIEAHRLMKNSVDSDNYVLLSKELADQLGLPAGRRGQLFDFRTGVNKYDGKNVAYLYSIIAKQQLKLNPFSLAQVVEFDRPPTIRLEKDYPVAASELLEYITDYTYRHRWIQGVDEFEFDENQVTRGGTEHVCVINGKHFNFVTVTKAGEPGQLIYGELTENIPLTDEVYQFYIITPRSDNSCRLEVEVYSHAKSLFKKLAFSLVARNVLRKNLLVATNKLLTLVKGPIAEDQVTHPVNSLPD